VLRTVYGEQPYDAAEQADQDHVQVRGCEKVVIDTVSHHVEGPAKGQILEKKFSGRDFKRVASRRAGLQDGTTYAHDVEGVVIEVFRGIERLAPGLCVKRCQELVRVAGHATLVVLQGCWAVSARSCRRRQLKSLSREAATRPGARRREGYLPLVLNAISQAFLRRACSLRSRTICSETVGFSILYHGPLSH
jgi:hypothetical protein